MHMQRLQGFQALKSSNSLAAKARTPGLAPVSLDFPHVLALTSGAPTFQAEKPSILTRTPAPWASKPLAFPVTFHMSISFYTGEAYGSRLYAIAY